MYKKIEKCRICGNKDLVVILDLGNQELTGVFPKDKDHVVSSGPLELVKCQEHTDNNCGLVQLRYTYDFNEMYGENYGYRSGLNQSMVKHLQKKVQKIRELISLSTDDIAIDIGSNDSTLLQSYPEKQKLNLIGIDPIGEKFKEYYPDYVKLIADFFSAEYLRKEFPDKKAKVITSIAMFYDLESPMSFMQDIYDILDNNGIWVFEQSYMPIMLEKNSYDTICHEHLEYYGLRQIKWMADRVGFKIIDIELNNINGGSFSVIAAKKESSFNENSTLVNRFLEQEKQKALNTLKPYEEFKNRVYKHRNELRQVISDIKVDGKLIIGYGASTKGNVILQFCAITKEDIPFIAEVNENKFGCYTPGTYIPIISEQEAKKMNPDYLFVLPWHFRENFLEREKEYLSKGGRLLMPLPQIEVINQTNLLLAGEN